MGIFLRYWKAVAVRAWTEAWQAVVEKTLPALIRDAVILVAAIFSFAALRHSLEGMHALPYKSSLLIESLIWAAMLAIGTVIIFAATFLFHAVFITPYRMYAEQEALLAELSPKELPAPFGPNWTIHEAIFALCPDAVQLKEKVGQRLMDLLATQTIVAWGRARNGGAHRAPLTLIIFDYWEQAEFTYFFLDRGNQYAVHVRSLRTIRYIDRPTEYSDLRFNRQSLINAWNALGPL